MPDPGPGPGPGPIPGQLAILARRMLTALPAHYALRTAQSVWDELVYCLTSSTCTYMEYQYTSIHTNAGSVVCSNDMISWQAFSMVKTCARVLTKHRESALTGFNLQVMHRKIRVADLIQSFCSLYHTKFYLEARNTPPPIIFFVFMHGAPSSFPANLAFFCFTHCITVPWV